jgi:hypothetical protein
MTTYETPEQAGPDLGVVQELIDEHLPFDCNVIPVAPNTWATHGSIPVGGESILAEFGNKAEAEAALVLLGCQ